MYSSALYLKEQTQQTFSVWLHGLPCSLLRGTAQHIYIHMKRLWDQSIFSLLFVQLYFWVWPRILLGLSQLLPLATHPTVPGVQVRRKGSCIIHASPTNGAWEGDRTLTSLQFSSSSGSCSTELQRMQSQWHTRIQPVYKKGWVIQTPQLWKGSLR